MTVLPSRYELPSSSVYDFDSDRQFFVAYYDWMKWIVASWAHFYTTIVEKRQPIVFVAIGAIVIALIEGIVAWFL